MAVVNAHTLLPVGLALLAGALAPSAGGASGEITPAPRPALEFIDTRFENASPAWYEFAADGVAHLHFLYDHERGSSNRAAGHFHFQLQGQPGARLVLEFRNLDNVWNGAPGSVARELKSVAVSADGRNWSPLATESLPGNRVRLSVEMPGPRLHVARVEPYRLSDLDRFLESIRGHRLVQIAPIGRTAGGLSLEMIRVGDPRAARRVFVRARAHPWEAGGNWVVQGLIRRLLQGDAEAEQFLGRYCLYAMPMANKDGVARGMTRFNLRGKDLNRDWDKPADPALAPENAALEAWLEESIRAGHKPDLALDLHNDGGGRLHLSRPPVADLDRHLEKMRSFEALLRRHTWFTEGSTQPGFRNSGTLGDGWLERYGIDAAVLELNCNWIAGLKEAPLGRHWETFGAGLARVFFDYFAPSAR